MIRKSGAERRREGRSKRRLGEMEGRAARAPLALTRKSYIWNDATSGTVFTLVQEPVFPVRESCEKEEQ